MINVEFCTQIQETTFQQTVFYFSLIIHHLPLNWHNLCRLITKQLFTPPIYTQFAETYSFLR
jgi:hypothetical protein